MSNKDSIYLVDCPRDAIQGIKYQILTDKKVSYINQLIKSNFFDCIDFGSFVSPKAVPQMSDTKDVIEKIDKINDVKLLAIIANAKGAEIGVEYEKIDYLGFPFSISETFQQKNTKASIAEAFDTVRYINDLIASKSKQELVVYISMAFGNPYNDAWSLDLVCNWVRKLNAIGIQRFSIADTTAEASVYDVHVLISLLRKEFPFLDFSIHLHSQEKDALLKINAAYEAGCRRFEGAILGYGGCPFAKDELVGNIPSELLIDRFDRGSFGQVSALMQGFLNMINDGI